MEALTQGLLWDYGEFKDKGFEDSYDKPAVKIATHSSLFRGGNNAMIQGILESERKLLEFP